jgi:hypothetical protein
MNILQQNSPGPVWDWAGASSCHFQRRNIKLRYGPWLMSVASKTWPLKLAVLVCVKTPVPLIVVAKELAVADPAAVAVPPVQSKTDSTFWPDDEPTSEQFPVPLLPLNKQPEKAGKVKVPLERLIVLPASAPRVQPLPMATVCVLFVAFTGWIWKGVA